MTSRSTRVEACDLRSIHELHDMLTAWLSRVDVREREALETCDLRLSCCRHGVLFIDLKLHVDTQVVRLVMNTSHGEWLN